jgi:aryl-alcohol dehydrogenase-like predicted oxidoreductase
MNRYLFLVIASLITMSCSKNSTIQETPPVNSSSVVAPTPEMEYVDICNPKNECKKFSRLAMGTDHLIQGDWTGAGEPELTEEQAFRVLDEAAKHGINFFDTSPIYVGGVENRLGKWRKSRAAQAVANEFYAQPTLNPDRKLYVLSKGGFPFDLYWAKNLPAGRHSEAFTQALQQRGFLDIDAIPNKDGTIPLNSVPPGTYASRLFGEPDQITQRLTEELGHTVTNLDGDITIYLMHRDDGDALEFEAIHRPPAEVKTILSAIGSKDVAGKFWMLGWSNWQTDRVNQSIELTTKNEALPKPAINSPYFSLFEMSKRTIHALGVQVTHAEMMDPNFQKGIKIMPYSPLGGFSILDKPAPQWDNAKKAAKKKYDENDPYWQNVFHAIFTDENEARWNRVVEFTKNFNGHQGTTYTVDQMINAYVLAHPRTDLLAVGAITVEQVQRTVSALQLSKRLTPQDLEYLYSGKR